MSITIHLPAVLARLSDGQRTLTANGPTLRHAVSDVSERFPALRARLVDATGGPYPFVTYYLNDDDIRLRGGFDAPVQDGDEVIVVPAVAGG